jgi:hypothetical protein
MLIDVNEHGVIRLKEVYNTLVLEAEKEKLLIVERDGKFEIKAIRKGKIESIHKYDGEASRAPVSGELHD